MTLPGLIATLIALALAVLAMRMARRGPVRPPHPAAAPDRMPPRKPAAAESKHEPSRDGEPAGATPAKPDAAESMRSHAKAREKRQPLADTVFKVYIASDEEGDGAEKSARMRDAPPKPRPASSDWS